MATVAQLAERVRARASLPAPGDCCAIRRAAGLSLADVASSIGVSSQTVWLWETGRRRPSNRHVERYAELLFALRDAVNGGVE